jgi:hypothetical protein
MICSDDKEIRAHKAVLESRSKYFETLFSHETKESVGGIIEIKDFGSKTINEMLRYLYYDKVENLAEIDIDLYIATDKYQLKQQAEMCLTSIYERLNTHNCIEIASFALKLKQKLLFINCLFMIYW